MSRSAIQVGGTIIGTAVGAYFGNAILGAQIGTAVGAVAGALLFPDPGARSPHLADKRIGDSSYGKPILDVWGADKIPGNLLWTGGIELRMDEVSTSGGSDGSTTSSFFASFGVGLCRGPVAAVRKVWLDHKLIYDISATNLQLATNLLKEVVDPSGTLSDDERADALANLLDEVAFLQRTMGIYLGTETQMPSVLQESYKGAGNVPAYRGLCYIEFDDLPLANYGNHHPTVQAEVLKVKSIATPSATVVPAVGAVLDSLVFDPLRQRLFAFRQNQYHVIDGVDNVLLTSGILGIELAGALTQIDFYQQSIYTIDSTAFDIGPEGDIYCSVQSLSFAGDSYLASRDPLTMQIKYIGGKLSPVEINDVTYIVNVPTQVGAVSYIVVGKFLAYYASWGFGGINTNRIHLYVLPNVINPFTGALSENLEHIASVSTGNARPWGLIIDRDGLCWAVCSSVLIQADPRTFIIVMTGTSTESIEITSVVHQGKHIAYDAMTHSLIIGGINPAHTAMVFVQFDIATRAVLQTTEPGFGVSDFNTKSWRRGVVGGNLWFGFGVQVLKRFSLATFTVTESINVVALGYLPGAQQVFGAVYDDEMDAVWAVVNFVGFVKFYLHRISYPAVAVAAVIEDIAFQVGYDIATDLDTSLVLDTMHGYTFSRHTSGLQNLTPLLSAYQIDTYESDWKLRFRPRGPRAPIATLTIDDLNAHVPGDTLPEPLQIHIQDKVQLPVRLYLAFSNPDSEYEQDNVYARRHQQSSGIVREEMLSTPIVLTNVDAKHRVERLLAERWQHLLAFTFHTHAGWLTLDPTDIITVTYNGRVYAIRLASIAIGANLVLEMQGLAYDPDTYIASDSLGSNPQGVIPQILPRLAATKVLFLDIPLLRDADDGPGFYVGATSDGGGTWPGCTVYESRDGLQFTELVTLTQATPYGVALTALADGSPYVFDRARTVRVKFTLPTILETVSELDVLNGANALLLGNELVQYATATQIDALTWDLSVLLRGRRGTEWATNTHATSERVVVLSASTLRRVASSTADIGVPHHYKAVTLGHPLSKSFIQGFANKAKGLYPYAPDHVRGTRDAGNNLTITWVRRARVGGEWRDLVDAALVDTPESYEIDVFFDLTVVRVLTTSNSTVTYTAAEQSADGYFPGDPILVAIYQLNAMVGRGFQRLVSL